MSRSIISALLVGVLAAGAGTASIVASAAEKAHKEDGHKHDEKSHKAHHGGVVSLVGHQEYELVAKPDALTLYVSSDEKPVVTKGATASVTLMSGADKNVVKLEPAGENKLEAKGSFKVASGTKVLATVTLPGKKPEQIRFTLK